MSLIPGTVKIYGDVQFGENCVIGEYSIIGYPYIETEESLKSPNTKVFIGNNCIIGSYVIIYSQAKIGDGTRIEDFCKIGENVTIGSKCRILHGVYGGIIYDDSEIGDNCIIAGICSERVKIGNNVRLFGVLAHRHRDSHLGWNDVIEDAPKIDDYVFIGVGAKIIGGIKIGKNSYVTAGAIVTKDVPEKSIVLGVNKIVPFKDWKGSLRDSKFFKRCTNEK